MPNVPEHSDSVKPAVRLALLDEIGFDIAAAHSARCECGTATVFVVDRVRAGLADVLLRCRLCGTDVVLAATPREQTPP